jgi:hypothetical protein
MPSEMMLKNFLLFVGQRFGRISRFAPPGRVLGCGRVRYGLRARVGMRRGARRRNWSITLRAICGVSRDSPRLQCPHGFEQFIFIRVFQKIGVRARAHRLEHGFIVVERRQYENLRRRKRA